MRKPIALSIDHVPVVLTSSFHTCSLSIYLKTLNMGTIIPILQMKTLSLGEVREFAQCLQLDGAELGLEPRSPDSKDHPLSLIIPKCTFCLCQVPGQFRADRSAGGAARKPSKVYKEPYRFCQVFCQGCFFQRCPEWKGKFETPKKLPSSTQGF